MDTKKLFKLFYGCSPEVIREKVILTPVFSLDLFRKECTGVMDFKGKLYSGFNGEYKNTALTVIKCGIGSAVAGDAVQLLDLAGVKELLFLGTCGGLCDCEIGDIVIAESAFNGEGFSSYYDNSFDMIKFLADGSEIGAAPLLNERLLKYYGEVYPKGLRPGRIFTVGSILAETDERLALLQKKGFKSIEMELSAVYQASANIGIDAGGILLVSDTPLETSFVSEIGHDLKKKDRNSRDGIVSSSLGFINS